VFLVAHTIKSDFKSFLVQKECLSKTLKRYYLRIVVMARRHFFLFCSQIHSRQFKFIPAKFKNHRAATVRGKKPHAAFMRTLIFGSQIFGFVDPDF